jgi:hypothetical protein
MNIVDVQRIFLKVSRVDQILLIAWQLVALKSLAICLMAINSSRENFHRDTRHVIFIVSCVFFFAVYTYDRDTIRT